MPSAAVRSHLNPDVATWLDLSDRDRILRLHAAQTEWFIAYPKAVEALRRIDTIIATPPSNRPRNLLIFGEPSIGKTQIIKAALRAHPPTHDGQSRWPILFIDAPPVPTEASLYDEILSVLNVPFRHTARTGDKKNQVFSVLAELKVRIIIIDELHNMLTHRPARQRDFLTVLKHMGNRLGISFIAAGTPDAVVALQSDRQMSSRFFFLPLPVWRFGREFRQLLAGFELLLPLKQPSLLSEAGLAARLHELSEGRLGELAILLVEATTMAIEEGGEIIDHDLLRRLDWVAPSVRLLEAERQLGSPLGVL
ncbi:TniB family NTP-binding protein [Indioceanicola profundi]|uniref:TniB family NTP-binding protein n=1 Tax=Indioceanicola profundi TaxID=2220096 RepID=UPI000E6AA485|nr:TniB family NTP-binding protein [Indioceanicola profundi]